MAEMSRWLIVPNIVPSGYLDTLSRKLGRRADTPIFTSESERIQIALKH
jgi:hypothetical protein